MHASSLILFAAADGLQLADYVVVLLYMLAVVGIGLFFSRQQHTSEDFFLGGRNVPWFAAGISLVVSLVSTLTYLGATGEVIKHGLAYNLAYWAMLPAFCVIIFAWLPFFMRLGLTSVYEYLEHRYGLAARWLGLALFTLILRVGWVSVIVVTLAQAVAHITHASATDLLGWEVSPKDWVIVLIVTVGIIATLYTMLGGIKAVIAIDVLQYCVLMAGAIATVALVVNQTQTGPPTWWHTMTDVKRTPLEIGSWDLSTRTSFVWVSMYIFFWYVCTYASDQVAMQRYFSMPSLRAAVSSSVVNFFGQILLTAVLSLCGMALLHYYTQFPQEIVPGIIDPQHAEAADEVFPHFIQYGLPAGLSGLVVAALFAVALSSIDSGLSSVSTALTVDLFRRLKPDRPPRQELLLARVLTVAMGVLVTGLAILMMRLPGQWNIIDTCLRTFDCALGPLAAMFIVGMLLPHVGQRAIIIAVMGGVCFAFGIAWWTELGWLLGLVEGESLAAVLETARRPSSFLAMPGSAVLTFLMAAVLGGFMRGPDPDKVRPLTWRGVVAE
ncbi:sodium/solute symporter [Pirellulales bacterium]|nr:sodium/solute symporter [Pirellulales bacterium]